MKIVDEIAKDIAIGLSDVEINSKYRLIDPNISSLRLHPDVVAAVFKYRKDPDITSLKGKIAKCRVEFETLINHSDDSVKNAVIEAVNYLHQQHIK